MNSDLTNRMTNKGYTLCALAELLGVHSKVISRWRAGGVPTKDYHIRALYKLFGRDLQLGTGCRPHVNHAFEKWLKQESFTVAAVAQRLGVAPVLLSQWRTGRLPIPTPQREQLAVLTGGKVPAESWL